MADLDPVYRGEKILAADQNLLRAVGRGAMNPATGGAGFRTPGMVGNYEVYGDVQRAIVTRIIKDKQPNIFDGPLSPSDLEHNAQLLTYDPDAKRWALKPQGEITVFLNDDGETESGTVGVIPIPKGARISVRYSKTAQAWFCMEQPRVAVVHVTSTEADANQIQSGETAFWDSVNSQWVIGQNVSIIRIGV